MSTDKPRIPIAKGDEWLLDYDEADLEAMGTPKAKAELSRRFLNRFRQRPSSRS